MQNGQTLVGSMPLIRLSLINPLSQNLIGANRQRTIAAGSRVSHAAARL